MIPSMRDEHGARVQSMQMQEDFGKQGGAGGRAGDWICPSCNNINFSSRKTCRKCPATALGAERIGLKPGDWVCPGCGDLVFATKNKCKLCNTKKPPPDAPPGYVAKPTGGDVNWTCHKCNAKQSYANSKCQVCGEPREREGAQVATHMAVMNV